MYNKSITNTCKDMLFSDETPFDDDDCSQFASSDDAEEQKMHQEYKKLVKEIECRNKVVAALKAQIVKLCANEGMSCCELRIVNLLQNRLEQECRKLKCLTNHAMHLQNFGAQRRYRSIPVEPNGYDENRKPSSPKPQEEFGESDSMTCSIQTDELGSESETRSDLCTSDSLNNDQTEALKLKMLQALQSKQNLCPAEKKLAKQLSASLAIVQESSCCEARPKPRPRSASRASSKTRRCGDQGSCSCGCAVKSRSSARNSHTSTVSKQRSHDSIDLLRKKVRCIEEVIGRLKRDIANKERQKATQQPQQKNIDEAIMRLRKHLCCLQKKAKKVQQEAACQGCVATCERLRQQLCVAQLAIKRIKEEIAGKESAEKGCSSPKLGQVSLEKLQKKLSRVQSAMINIKNELCRRDDENQAQAWRR